MKWLIALLVWYGVAAYLIHTSIGFDLAFFVLSSILTSVLIFVCYHAYHVKTWHVIKRIESR